MQELLLKWSAVLLPRSTHAKLLPLLGKILDTLFSKGEAGGARRSALIVFALRIGSAALAYIMQVFLARWMGASEYGIFIVVWTVVIILSVFSGLGFSVSLLRFIPEYLEKKQYELLNGLLFSARFLVLLSSTTIAVVGVAIAWAFSDFIGNAYILPLYLIAICLPMHTYTGMLEGIARAQDWQLKAMLPDFIGRPLLVLAFMLIALLLGYPPTAVTACIVTIAAVWTITFFQTIMMEVSLSKVRYPAPRRLQIKSWLLVSVPMLAVDGFFQLITSSDVILIGLWLPPDQVGIYFAASRTLALMHFVYYAVRAASAPRMARLYHSGDRDGLKDFVTSAAKMTFWPTLLMGGFVMAVGPFLLSLFGEDFAQGTPILYILVIGVLARASVGPVDALLTLSGHQNTCAKIYASVFVVNLILNTALIPVFGLYGAALATTSVIFFEACILYRSAYKRLGLHTFILPLKRRETPVNEAG
ncbi:MULTISPECIES: lipopolysaccharide biosynthesis protein [unclassified Pseudovibrio]|uniref:lipopolysaccharide biosynthesis protein n=1 Tax=unclassified Pseudovibrio TaxID=2627060 RepID=UPI0007AED395|nr:MULTISPECIES: lipopolysaccharide biosynthesis protein [unclassified Pseudovibrio]KZK99756.1 Polysaccharide biosynthesis protein [Pseudovibrio sp. W74]KZL11943.1 Polysaccharide biosynthesis protein [Pseudovibrio sp. Ad14]